MKKWIKPVAFALLALAAFELVGCKTLSKALGVPYGQVKKAEKAKK